MAPPLTLTPPCPSGAGKTTLLNALAGQLPRNAALELCGAISVNGVSVDASAHRQGYVQQEDIFFSQLTVKCAPRSTACDALNTGNIACSCANTRAPLLFPGASRNRIWGLVLRS